MLGDLNSAEAQSAIDYLSLISMLFVLLAMLATFRSILQGLGYGMVAMIAAFGEVAGRIIGGFLAVYLGSFTIICLATPMAWLFAGTYCLVMLLYHLRRINIGK